MANEMLQRLTDFLNSEEGRKSIEEFQLKVEREEAHRNRWANRMWNRIKDDIDSAVERLVEYYDSDRYYYRESKRGFEPREALLWVLLDCARLYGKECTDESYANPFTGEMYHIGSFVIQVMHGQGSVIRIDKVQ